MKRHRVILASAGILLSLILSTIAPAPAQAQEFFGKDWYCLYKTYEDWWLLFEAITLMKNEGMSPCELRRFYADLGQENPWLDKLKGEPVALASGQERRQEEDIDINSRGLPTEIRRYYNNRADYDGPLGPGWSLSVDDQVFVLGNMGEQVALVRMGDGDAFRYYQEGDGTFSPDEGNYDTLTYDSGTFTLRKKSGSTYLFTKQVISVGQTAYDVYPIASITDRNGNAQHYVYDSAARLTIFTDTVGRQFFFSYDERGKLISIVDPLNRTYSYAYDESGHLSTYTNPSGHSRQYAYDSNGYLSQVTDFMGNPIVQNVYDHYGRVINQQYNGGTLLFGYAPGKTTYTDQKSNIWLYEYDELGNMLREVDPENNNKTQEYDLKQNRVAKTDKSGHRGTYTFDSRGNVLTATDPLGQVTTYTYEPVYDNIASITNAMQVRTEFDYDVRGNLIRRVDDAGGPNQRIEEYVVDTQGQVIQVIDPDGRITGMAYNAEGNLASLREGNNTPTQFIFDIMGRLLTVEDPLGAITLRSYDSENNLISITDPLNHTTTMTYNNNRDILTSSDPNNHVITKVYNSYGQLIEMVNALNHSTAFSYSVTGVMSSLLDANVHVTTYMRDAFDRVREEVYQDSSTKQYYYDVDGRLTEVTDQAGSTITFTYDELGRLVRKSFPSTAMVTYAYDAKGRMISVEDGNAAIIYNYDSLGRVLEERTVSVQAGVDRVVSFSYDGAGNRTRLTYPDGAYISYVYDAVGRLDKLIDQTGSMVADFSYDASGRRSWLGLQNGVNTTYNYDAAGRLIGLETVNAGQASVASFQYTLDNTGNRTSTTTLDGTSSFGYDNAYRVTAATYPGDRQVQYIYDPVGNRVQVDDDGISKDYVTDDMNRILSASGVAFAYDAHGNLTGDGTNIYHYDIENHLIQVDTPVGTVGYGYDPLGRLFSRVDSLGTRYFIHAGQQIVAEYGNGGSLQSKYVYGTGIDEPLVMERGGQKYYYSRDGIGSVVTLTNALGQVIESYTYDVYGKPNATSSIGNPYLFTGRQYDTGTGIYYYRARWYAPEIGRFTAKDPIEFAGGDINLYGYVMNDPINFTDALGLYLDNPTSMPVEIKTEKDSDGPIVIVPPYSYYPGDIDGVKPPAWDGDWLKVPGKGDYTTDVRINPDGTPSFPGRGSGATILPDFGRITDKLPGRKKEPCFSNRNGNWK